MWEKHYIKHVKEQADFGNEIQDAVTYVEKAVAHAARQPAAGQCRVGIRGTRKFIWDIQNNNFGVCELTGGKTVPIATFFRLTDAELARFGYTGPTRFEDYFLDAFRGGHELLP